MEENFARCLLLLERYFKGMYKIIMAFFCGWLHSEVKLGHFIELKTITVEYAPVPLMWFSQGSKKSTAGEIETNGFVHALFRTVRPCMAVSIELPWGRWVKNPWRTKWKKCASLLWWDWKEAWRSVWGKHRNAWIYYRNFCWNYIPSSRDKICSKVILVPTQA